jgi:phosphoglycolate phosphatase
MLPAYLFDIDGTILKVKHKVNRKLIRRILERFGINHINVEELDFAGKTDRDIFSDLLRQPDEDMFHQVKQIYLQELERNLTSDDIHVYSGVHDSLEHLSGKSAWTGILTGNFARAARIKLAAIGLLDRFRFGAFGDDHHDRNELPPSAFEELVRFSGEPFRPADLVIIGDTPRDIACARAFGSVAVAVSTGTYSYDELSDCGPDTVLRSMDEFPAWNEKYLATRA